MKGWKRFEYKAAEYFGGHTTEKKNVGDVITDKFGIECKYRKDDLIGRWYRKIRGETPKSKVPVLCVKVQGMKGFYLILHSDEVERFCVAFLTDKGYNLGKG